jgi:hypothetical protein
VPELNKHRFLLALLELVILVAFSSCQPAPGQPTPVSSLKTQSITVPKEDQTEETIASQEITPTFEVTPEETNDGTVPGETTESPTEIQPTPAPTLSDWRDAPISPETISDRVIEIYETGQALGRDPHSFSVIGDCQSIPFVFMGPYGRGELEPDSAESQLWKAINWFDGSFKRWAVTSRGGFTAASILSPIQADPEMCKPGETPLTCEFRLNNPAFALVTLETWLEPETVDRYEVYLRQIIDQLIERGTVPILLTKADASELRGEKHIINPVIVNVAYEYQLPVVNFWRAAQYMDNYGIDPEREGFHLSQGGYDLKNTLALRALYQVWTAVEGGEMAEVFPTPTPTPDPTPQPEVEMTVPNCPAGCIFFGTAKSRDGEVTPGGVWAIDPEGGALTRILEAGFDLQDVSQDGNRLLVNLHDRLYVVDLVAETYELVTDTFNNDGRQGAYWNSDETVIIRLDHDNPLETESGAGFNLFSNAPDGTIYFESGRCTSKDYCESEGVFRLETNGTPEMLETTQDPVFSPDGERMAFLNPEAATADNFYNIHYLILEDVESGAASRRILYFPEVSGFMVYADVEAYRLSPDGKEVFILYDVYSEYYEYSLRLETYLWDLESGIQYEFGELEGVSGSLSPRMVWSPEGDRVFFFLTDLTEEGEYQISIYQTDLVTGERLALHAENILSDSNYIYLTNLYWRE